MGGAAHADPGFLVATGAMEEVKDRILLLGALLVAVRGVDGQATVDAEDLAVIPRVAHGAAVVRLRVVLRPLAGDDEHVEEAGAVALDQDVLRVVHAHAVHDEIVGVDLRGRERDLDGPDVSIPVVPFRLTASNR